MKHHLKQNIQVVKSSSGNREDGVVNLVDEHHLELVVNGKTVNNFICINENLKEIVIGWLVGHKYIFNIKDIQEINFNDDKTKVDASIINSEVFKECRYESFNYKDEWIFNLVDTFLQGTKIHKQTSGTHCCILSINGKIELIREDIGRHNAIDKVIGYIYMNNINVEDCIVFTSGRISTDVVSKVINSKIPVLVSKSVTSYQATELAKGHICLICKAWPDSFEVYT